MMDESPLIQLGPLRAFLVQGVPNGHSPHERKTLQILSQKIKINLRDEIKEQNNQSHPPFSVQVTSQSWLSFHPRQSNRSGEPHTKQF
jgi:hypothetical protein